VASTLAAKKGSILMILLPLLGRPPDETLLPDKQARLAIREKLTRFVTSSL
jgi:hypothetical protein